MRILTFFICTFCLASLSNVSNAEENLKSIEDVISYAIENSPKMQEIKESERGAYFQLESVKRNYNIPELALNRSISNAINPISNPIPFAVTRSSINSRSEEISTHSNFGLKPFISSKSTNYEYFYANGMNALFSQTILSAGLGIDLLQNIIGRMDTALLTEVKIKQQIQKYIKEQNMELFILELLGDLMNLSFQKQVFQLENERCSYLENLYELNKSKSDKKQFLYSEANYLNCTISLNQMKYNIDNLTEEVKYKISESDKVNQIKIPDNLKFVDVKIPEDSFINDNLNLKMAKLLISVSDEELRHSTYAQLPEVKANGSFSTIKNQKTPSFNDEYKSYDVNVTARIKFGDSVEDMKHKQHYHESKINKANYLLIENHIKSEFFGIKNNLEKSIRVIDSYKKIVSIRQERLAKIQQDFAIGKASIGDMTDAQSDLNNSMKSLLSEKCAASVQYIKYLSLISKLRYQFLNKCVD